MNRLHHIATLIDGLNGLVFRTIAWLSLAMVLVQIFVVIMRYVFGTGSIQIQESITYMHAILFMIGAAGTFLSDDHVRVDIFYRTAKPKTKAVINLCGVIFFLIPVCLTIIYTAHDYVAISWRVREGSLETSGIQALYLLKTVIPIMAGLLMLQGISQAIKAAHILRAHKES